MTVMSIFLLLLSITCKFIIVINANDLIFRDFPVVYTKGVSNNLNSMTFLICVNATDDDCIATATTPSIKPNVSLNKSEKVIIGDCDHGPLTYKVVQREGESQYGGVANIKIAIEYNMK